MEVFGQILGVVFVVLFIYVSIALHELGHLIPAKKFRVPVPTYAIGFGPTLFSFRRKETTYALKLLPFGGYVHLGGMTPPLKPGRKDRWFTRGQSLEETEDKRAFWRLPVHRKIIVMFGGPFVNLMLAVIGYVLIFSAFGVPAIQPKIASVAANTPAAVSGLVPGERIVSINGRPVNSAEDLLRLLQNTAGAKTEVGVVRQGVTQNLLVVPESSQADAHQGVLGVSLAIKNERVPVWDSVYRVGEDTGRTVLLVANLPQQLYKLASSVVSGGHRDGNLVGLVGIARISGEVTAAPQANLVDKTRSLLGIFSSLNLALFVFNLIPILPFDGGHIAGALWEGIRRRTARLFGLKDPGPVNVSYLAPLTLVVIAAFVVMGVVVAWADIFKPFTLH